jgi:ABC-type phosphate transport system permease subunit
MSFDVSTAMNIILFLALIPISYFWLRRAWRILFKRDFSEVALKHGEAPPNAARFAPWTGMLNLVCGAITATVVVLVVAVQLPFDTWTAIAGSTLWCKFMIDFGISRHAHGAAKRDAALAAKRDAARTARP